jgi:hypothetical protein
MNAWITDYVKGCATCQQNKIITHKTCTPAYRIPTTAHALPFQQVAMDLITGLPMCNGKDAILTIVDHGCSRAAIFLPCTTTVTGAGIAQLYLDNVYRWFGLPTKVISDRDPCFTSHFGRALSQLLGIQQNLSSAFHPQTDSVSERANQWIEQYLRLITSSSPKDWTHWLTIASTVHNDRVNQTLGISPSQALLGCNVALTLKDDATTSNQLAGDQIQNMMEKRATAIDAINRTARALNVIPSQYKEGAQVWLEVTNLKIKHQKTKLAPKRYGPFTVEREISPVAYQLRLPMSWGIHDVFHASLLLPYHETNAHGPNFSCPPPDLIDGQEEYEVERIISHRRHGRSKQLQYLIKWVGYPHHDNTWEPANQVHAPDLVKAYHRLNPLLAIKTLRTSVQQCQPASTTPLLSSSLPSTLRCPLNPLSPTLHNQPPTHTPFPTLSSSQTNPFITSDSSSPTLTKSIALMHFNTLGSARTTRAPFTTPTDPR